MRNINTTRRPSALARTLYAAQIVAQGVTLLGVMALCYVALIALPGEPSDYGPCAHEDSANCYWDSYTRGNGVGQSFVDIGGKRYGLAMH